MLAKLDELISTINGIDFATQSTLASLNGKDFATETTLELFRQTFIAEDFATQGTLLSLLNAFNAEDFATQTTLASVNNEVQLIHNDTQAITTNTLNTFLELQSIDNHQQIIENLLTAIDTNVLNSFLELQAIDNSTSATSTNTLNTFTELQSIFAQALLQTAAQQSIDAKVATETTLAALETHAGVIETNTGNTATDAAAIEALLLLALPLFYTDALANTSATSSIAATNAANLPSINTDTGLLVASNALINVQTLAIQTKLDQFVDNWMQPDTNVIDAQQLDNLNTLRNFQGGATGLWEINAAQVEWTATAAARTLTFYQDKAGGVGDEIEIQSFVIGPAAGSFNTFELLALKQDILFSDGDQLRVEIDVLAALETVDVEIQWREIHDN